MCRCTVGKQLDLTMSLTRIGYLAEIGFKQWLHTGYGQGRPYLWAYEACIPSLFQNNMLQKSMRKNFLTSFPQEIFDDLFKINFTNNFQNYSLSVWPFIFLHNVFFPP